MVVIEILLRLSALLLYIVAGLSALAALSGMILSVIIGLLNLDPFAVVILTMLSIIIFGSILRGATCLLDRIKIKIVTVHGDFSFPTKGWPCSSYREYSRTNQPRQRYVRKIPKNSQRIGGFQPIRGVWKTQEI